MSRLSGGARLPDSETLSLGSGVLHLLPVAYSFLALNEKVCINYTSFVTLTANNKTIVCYASILSLSHQIKYILSTWQNIAFENKLHFNTMLIE